MDDSLIAAKEKEYIADLLKERIYATIALLAVLISIDTQHYSPLHAAYIMSGTIVSLWAASIVASQMSRRMVYRGVLNPQQEMEHQIRRHAPMLASLIFPMIMIGLAIGGIISLSVAVNVSIVSVLLLMVAWSILSALSVGATKIPIALLVLAELAIGLSVVSLKVVVGH